MRTALNFLQQKHCVYFCNKNSLQPERLFKRHLPLPTAVDAIVNFVKPEKQRRCVDTRAWLIIIDAPKYIADSSQRRTDQVITYIKF